MYLWYSIIIYISFSVANKERIKKGKKNKDKRQRGIYISIANKERVKKRDKPWRGVWQEARVVKTPL